MTAALWLLAVLGVLGAFDTFYYHEWRARLPARRAAATELKLHAARDFVYAVVFGTLPWLSWNGAWAAVFAAILLTEVVLTMWDFLVEVAVRKPFGDVYGGERLTHNAMGTVYGAMTACLVPELWRAWSLPAALVRAHHDVPPALVAALSIMAAGVLLSGVRDLYAALGLPGGSWPWPKERE
jgi:hypothetical protein